MQPSVRTTRPDASEPANALSALQAAAALGDAVALFDLERQTLLGASAAWLALQPALAAGASFAEVERIVPGLPDALRAAADTPRRLALGACGEWEAELVALAGDRALARIADRREHSRAVQRQLDDREQLLFTSRVVSVGEMATTLAHELNQPIGAAANLLRGLRNRLARRRAMQAEEAEALDRAVEQVMFASRVIARIREFTHSHQPRHGRVDLAALLRSSASLLDWDVRRSQARVVLDVPPGSVAVRGDPVMLQQVIVNLMRNALDAIRSDPPPDPQLALTLVAGAKEVELSVCDNGCGLGDEAQARLFVPFASTKPSGMGIGLSICRSFVELHQGRLWFSRNPGRGATFHLSLPLLAAAETGTATEIHA